MSTRSQTNDSGNNNRLSRHTFRHTAKRTRGWVQIQAAPELVANLGTDIAAYFTRSRRHSNYHFRGFKSGANIPPLHHLFTPILTLTSFRAAQGYDDDSASYSYHTEERRRGVPLKQNPSAG